MKSYSKIWDEVLALITPEEARQHKLSLMIAMAIHVAMEAQGVSQKELARRLNADESIVSRWLSGDQNLSLSTIARIELALQVEVLTVLHEGIAGKFRRLQSQGNKVAFAWQHKGTLNEATRSVLDEKMLGSALSTRANIQYNPGKNNEKAA